METVSDKKIIFMKQLKQLYKKIDQSSTLLWSHDNNLTQGKKLRSQNDKSELNWKTKYTQIGYGEIAMGSLLKFFNLLQNISEVIKSLNDYDKFGLVGDLLSYNLTNQSLFLDIGSGFGKPVFHSAFQLNCESCGIEVVPARVEFCIDFFYEFLQNKDFFEEDSYENLKNTSFLKRKKMNIGLHEFKNDEEDLKTSIKNIKDKSTNTESLIADSEFSEIEEKQIKKLKKLPLKKKKPVKYIEDELESSVDKSDVEEDIDKSILHESLNKLKYDSNPNWTDKIKFHLKDATKLKSYSNENGKHYTHIYSYNKLMNFECRKKMSKILNKTNFKILSWYSNPNQTLKAGLKKIKFLCKLPMNATSTEKFSVYVYMKTK